MDRLTVNYDIQPESLKAVVPNLILQPLVENAIKHGFGNTTENGSILIKTYIENDAVHMLIEDDGVGCDNCDSLLENAGIGLSNTHERLKQIYKNKFTFEIDSKRNQGFKVHVSIPLHYATY